MSTGGSKGNYIDGTDGSDYKHRQRVADHHKSNPQYKKTLGWVFAVQKLYIVLAGTVWCLGNFYFLDEQVVGGSIRQFGSHLVAGCAYTPTMLGLLIGESCGFDHPVFFGFTAAAAAPMTTTKTTAAAATSSLERGGGPRHKTDCTRMATLHSLPRLHSA
jgi:hypothetical protein